MNAKEFLKKEGINEVDEGCLHYDDDAEWVNERILTELLEKYHQAKLKLLGIPDVSVSFSERIQNLIDYRGKKVGECIELNDIEEAARQRIKQEQLVEIVYVLNER